MLNLASDLNRKTGMPLSGSGGLFTGDIQVFFTWIPEFDTDRPQKYLTSQVTSVERLERPCLGSVNRSPVLFNMDAPMPELETDHPQKYRTSQVTSIERPECPCLGTVNRSPVILSF